jgi:hypothetical protein
LSRAGRARGVAVGFGLIPVAQLVLVLLVVDVLFGARPGHVLVQLVAGVHAVGRAGRRGDRGADLVGGRPPYWRYSVRMSGVLTNRFGRMKSAVSSEID